MESGNSQPVDTQQTVSDISVVDRFVDALGPKDDKYVNFLKKNKNIIGSEIELVFSGKFGGAAAALVMVAGLGLRYALQASSQYHIDLPIIDYHMEKTWLFFRNVSNSLMSLFNCAEATCDFINFAARKKVASIMREQASKSQGTDQFILHTTANEISRKATNKLVFWDLPQTLVLLGASGIWNSPDQRLIINGINMALEGYERHKFGSSVLYYFSQLSKAASGKLVLGGMIFIALTSTFNNLMNDISKLSRNSVNLEHLKPQFEYRPMSDIYRNIGSTVTKTNQLAFKKGVNLDLTNAKIMAKSAKYFNRELVYIYDIKIPGGHNDTLNIDIGSKYHRILTTRDLGDGGIEILGDLIGFNVSQDERVLPEPTWAFDGLFRLLGMAEPTYSPFVFVPRSEYNDLFKKQR